MLIEQIDETNFIEKNEEGRKRVELKLKRFDRQVETSTEQTKKANKYFNYSSIDWNLLYDPTIWAYKTLRDKQGNPLILRGFQDKIINDKNQFIVTAAANQIGKTWTGCVKAIHHSLFVNNASVLIVSKSESQAIMILDEIKWLMLRAKIPFEPVIGDVENRTELHLRNEDTKGVSVIRCLAPTTGVLAYPATLIIPDEIGFWRIDNQDPVDFFEQVIISRIQETQDWKDNCVCGVHDCGHFTMGQIFAISNPNAQQGALWYLWNNNDYHQYRVNWLAKSGRRLEQYEKLRRSKPSPIFDSVYAAVFSSATGGFITLGEWNDAVREYQLTPPLTTPIFAGGDFAGEDTKSRDVDETILFFVQQIKESDKDYVKVTHYKDFPLRVKKEEVYSELAKYANLIKFAYDKMGVGDSVKNDLKEKGILSEHQIEALTYSLPNKSEVYYNLKHLFEQRKIIVPNLPKLKEQLLGLRFERTAGGYIQKGNVSIPLIKIHHKTEGLHDDWADSLANACYVARILKGVPVDLTIVSQVEKPKLKGKGDLLFCKECEDYHWTSEPHIKSWSEA